jgi:hypothetical protein
MFDPPNLDALTTPELSEYAEVFRTLADYCDYAAEAKAYRPTGYIEAALDAERACETLYRRLPEWARW